MKAIKTYGKTYLVSDETAQGIKAALSESEGTRFVELPNDAKTWLQASQIIAIDEPDVVLYRDGVDRISKDGRSIYLNGSWVPFAQEHYKERIVKAYLGEVADNAIPKGITAISGGDN